MLNKKNTSPCKRFENIITKNISFLKIAVLNYSFTSFYITSKKKLQKRRSVRPTSTNF